MSLNVLINFALYQLAWFVSVLGAAHSKPWVGVFSLAIILTWHFAKANQAWPEFILLLIALLIGAMFDQALLSADLIVYESHGWGNQFVPVWILTLWAGFVTLLNISLRWLRGRWLIAVLFGAIGGPLAYSAAESLGAVNLNANPLSYLALSIGWALLTPLLIKLAQQFDGYKAYV